MTPSGHDLEGVRSELGRLGYLDHRFERFLLQDALRSRQTAGTVLLLTAKVGLLSGLGLAMAHSVSSLGTSIERIIVLRRAFWQSLAFARVVSPHLTEGGLCRRSKRPEVPYSHVAG